MVPFDYYGGTGIETVIEYETCNTSTTTLGSNWATSTSGASTSSSIIRNYEEFMRSAARIQYKQGSTTYDDWNDLVTNAYKMGYGTTANTWYSTSADGTWNEAREIQWNTPVASPQMRLRDIIRSRQAPLVITSRKPMPTVTDVRETRARETLLRVLGEDKFKRFLKHGFVSVRAKSGLVYQIFPGHGITNVYEDGEKVERLCVVLRGNFPPTDSLIMRYLLILNDERDFRSHAIKHTVYKKRPEEKAVIKKIEPLQEVWNRLRVVA
jgi:hypothetical protein